MPASDRAKTNIETVVEQLCRLLPDGGDPEVKDTGLMSQPIEGYERANPIPTTACEILTDSAGPGRWRGGAGGPWIYAL
jgi:hypothetical protein